MNWEELFKFFGGTAAFTGLLAYLGKLSIESYLSGKLESHKNNLERIASEHAIRFQHLHTERANVIKEFYAKLVALDESLHSTLRGFQAVGEPPLQEKVNELGKQFNQLREYYLPKRIYFEEPDCVLIDTILETAKDVFFDITTYPVDTSDFSYRHDREPLNERQKFWERARNIHKNEITTLKQNLEGKFRIILGINV